MDALLLVGAIGAAAAGTGAIYRWWLRPLYGLLTDALRAAVEVRDIMQTLRPIAENQQRIIRLLDENGGGWRQRTSHRLEKIEAEQIKHSQYLAELCERRKGGGGA